MSKGLEALYHPRIKLAKVDISTEGKHNIAYMLFDNTKQYAVIEQELKEYGEYKAIEEELEVNLITLFKALKNGIWTKGGFYSDTLEEKPVFIGRPEIGICSYYDEVDENYNILLHDENVMCIYTYDYDFMVRQTRLKDYGKTWALTKEELL